MKQTVRKPLIPLFLALTSLWMGGCQSVEQLSIDYMLPAEVQYPVQLKRVAVVNNVSDVPESRRFPKGKDQSDFSSNEYVHLTRYLNGDAGITAESLAEGIADNKFFEEVVLCDSALRAGNTDPGNLHIPQAEVQTLTKELGVDCLIAVENIQLRSVQTAENRSNQGLFWSRNDVKVYPAVTLYLPNRRRPMVTISCLDSIYWEEAGCTTKSALAQLPPEEEVVKQASDYAGLTLVKHLLPHWTSDTRYFYAGGSPTMRDATVYARENNWKEANHLWQQVYDQATAKNKKRHQMTRMRTAFNLALSYEMQDNLQAALQWVRTAGEIAYVIDKVERCDDVETMDPHDLRHYLLALKYAAALEQRIAKLPQLEIQMQRFKEDF